MFCLVLLYLSLFYVVSCVVIFVFVLCFVSNVACVSGCSFLIDPSVLSNGYLYIRILCVLRVVLVIYRTDY